ncbi:HesA/MoeB/ThiF family protein [Shewanella schlegeliana]|uniref:HesA/MoeB/ThiF family protein n=1 Tax=Shewanella schlegeliana TaxID=190308 RepID=A0ABS1SVR2_9GAMM|nr:HesA/MoeB/ThiF family protein [Shewanella schlegeliana]MBL4912004.1 HesA/MoeB/ThiF family protein [Shewanella schlegeliana]MCL1111620.1 HesA/MoeB/ThiF family protein [Shewanella schlegeliana]GIU35298.1 thiamine biosynthesis protein ThiF [Shewanella schlegeliana]
MALSDSDFIRYSRQVLLPEVGETGQLAFIDSHVVIIGVGGLGNLAAQQLAAAGVGKITLVDGDCIALSNLPRQLLFSDADLGYNKVDVARRKLSLAYPQTQVDAVGEFLTDDNMGAVLGETSKSYDLLLDCSDNFDTRQRINRFAIKSELPLVSASAAHFNGQLLNIDQRYNPNTGCYHCLFPAEMSVSQSCQTVGILGPMVGTLASMQALMALQQLLGDKQTVGKLFRFDGKRFSWRELNLPRNQACGVCGAGEGDRAPVLREKLAAGLDEGSGSGSGSGLKQAAEQELDLGSELGQAGLQSAEKDYV